MAARDCPLTSLRVAVVVVDGFLDKRDLKKNRFNQRDFVWTCFQSQSLWFIPMLLNTADYKTSIQENTQKYTQQTIGNND